MKICDKCGAHNSDERIFCLDCGETLGERVSDVREQKINEDIDAQIEKMYNKNDPLHVSGVDKVVGMISLICAFAALTLIVVGSIVGRSTGVLWLAVMMLGLSAIEALVPKLTWGIEKIRLSFTINGADDAEPSDLYLVGRRISAVVLAIAGALLLAIGICALLNLNCI